MPEVASSRGGVCALCGTRTSLELSHIIPKFVFRWFRDTSATGRMRYSRTPNKRVQDGLKTRLLCSQCESRFSFFEDQFARHVFHPLNEDPSQRIRYEDWLLKFCVSVCWRIVQYVKKETDNNFVVTEKHHRELAKNAEQTWHDFLLGNTRRIGQFEIHLLPMSELVGQSPIELPDNINRYLLRSIDFEIVGGREMVLAYVKMGIFLVFGFLVPPVDRWRGSKVCTRGVLRPRHFELPAYVFEYVCYRARHSRQAYGSISERQQQIIERDVRQDKDRFHQSETKVAMEADVRRFGLGSIVLPTKRTD